MKKFLNLTLAAALAFGFVACQKTNNGQEPNNVEGETYVSMSFTESTYGTRVTDGQDYVAGITAENTVKKAHFLAGGTSVLFDAFTETGTGTGIWEAGAAKRYTGSTGNAVQTALVVNAPTSYKPELVGNITISIDLLSELAHDTQGFTMSTKSNVPQKIEAGVKEAEVTGTKNTLSYEVERLVSKVQVTQPTGGISVNVNGFPGAKVKDAKFSLAGSADKIYVFTDKAGTRNLVSPGTDQVAVYTDFQSAIHTNAVWNGVTPRDGVTKVSDKKLVGKGTGWDPNKQSADIVKSDKLKLKESKDTGIYFLENSVNKASADVQGLDYKDIAHVKVYVQFLPAVGQVYKVDDTGAVVLAEAADFDNATGVLKAVQENTAKHTDLAAVVNTEGTFYKGEANGRLYSSLTAARADGNVQSKKYAGGKMVWLTPANRQVAKATDDFPSYLDTRRNNIYALNVTEIIGLGENYDVNDPTDPNIPKPEDNPDEPTPNTNTPVYTKDTYVKVKATVLKWNLVHRAVKL